MTPGARAATGHRYTDTADVLAGLGAATGAVVATDTVRDGGTDVNVVGDFTGGVQRGLNVRR